MTTETKTANPSAARRDFIWNFLLGFLISALSVLTAASNYMAFQSEKTSDDLQSEGDRSLALSNTDYTRANQFIILDYTMYDGEYIQRGVDDFAADYYKNNFSQSLQSSIDRGSAFDDQYYNDMYAASDQSFQSALDSFEAANAEKDREGGYQLAMLVASVGLAFAAYASLLNNANFIRAVFTLLSLALLGLGSLQLLITWAS
ncbi:MAG: hypothetical protein IT313_10300 [Anaerolineales bacterium]|nr:hypothetical protein [Anaerolineales bacterium]